MKKSLFELTIEEFTRVICDCPERYSVYNRYVDDNGNIHNDEIEGTYEEIVDKAIRNNDKELFKFAERELFDYNIRINDLDIYDYLEHKTNKFEGARVRIIERMIEDCIDDIMDDRYDYVDRMIKKGWKGYTMMEETKFDEDDNTEKEIDYEDAFDKLLGDKEYRDYLLNSALAIIEMKSNLPAKTLNTEGDTERADEEEQNGRGTAVEKRNDKADKKAGRPVKPFDDVVAEQGNKEAIKSRLHALIDEKKDKGAVLYMKAAIILGLVQRPTYQQFKKEFGNIVSKQQYGKCLREEIYTQDEIEGAKSAIGKI